MSARNIVFLVMLLAGCREMPALPAITTPYKMDVQQGNVVTQEMVAKLQPGMTRNQVRFALGTPLVVDPFHSDRWDYVYLYQKAGTVTEQRRIIVIFQDDKLLRIEGDVVPAAKPGPVAPAAPRSEPPPVAAAEAKEAGKQEKPAAEKPAAEKPAEQRGFFGRMLERLGF